MRLNETKTENSHNYLGVNKLICRFQKKTAFAWNFFIKSVESELNSIPVNSIGFKKLFTQSWLQIRDSFNAFMAKWSRIRVFSKKGTCVNKVKNHFETLFGNSSDLDTNIRILTTTPLKNFHTETLRGYTPHVYFKVHPMNFLIFQGTHYISRGSRVF